MKHLHSALDKLDALDIKTIACHHGSVLTGQPEPLFQGHQRRRCYKYSGLWCPLLRKSHAGIRRRRHYPAAAGDCPGGL